MTANKKDMKGFFQENYPFLLAFFLPVLIMLAVFAGKCIYPFGDNSFLRTDMYHQYAPFFSEFWEKLHTGGSLFYSWDIGLGTNFTALYGYYLASPMNWFVFLCPRGLIIEFMTYLIVFKIGLCGVTMSWYLSRHFRTKEPGIAVFGILYALCGYMAAYSWNIMWLDCLWLMPLILLGVERLVSEGKCFLYCITLALCILSNYYISIMVCLFLVLYFIGCLIMLPTRQKCGLVSDGGETVLEQKRTNYLKPVLRFAIYSLLAGGLAAFILIPEISALGMTASGNISFPKTLSSYFPVFDMLVRHLMPVSVEIGLDHWPNLYSGLIVLPLFVLYIMNQNVHYKEKIVKSGLLLLFFASFSMNIPNFIWHGFHYPNSLPCRQSFLYTILLLTMCYEGYRDLRSFSRGQLTAAVCIPAAFILLAEKLTVENEKIPFYVFYISIAFLGLYGILAYLYKRRRAAASTLAVLFFGLIILESAVNTSVTSVTVTSRSGYLKNTGESRSLLASLREDDSSFFRVEKEKRKTKNDGAFIGYRSASIFSSTANANITALYKKFGLEGSTNAYSFNGATPLIKALFSVKYTLTTRTERAEGLEELYSADGEVSLIKNLYTLPPGFMIPSDLNQLWEGSGSKITAQNSFVALTSSQEGGGDLFLPVESTSSGSTATIPIEEDGYYIAEIPSGSVEDITVSYNGTTQNWSDVDRGYLIDLGYCKAGNTITVSSEQTDANLRLTAYQMDIRRFKEYILEMEQQGMKVETYSDTSISGQITSREDGALLLTIPYETGWSLYVDGQEAEIIPFSNALISVPLTAGTHSIELKYQPEGLRTGIMITVISLALLLLLYCLRKLFTAWKQEKATASEAEKDKVAEIQLEQLEDKKE